MLRGQSRWINCHLNSLVCRILLMHSVSIQALMLSKSQFIINKQKIPIVVTLLSIVLQILIKYLPIWIPPDIRISGLLCWMWGKNRWDSYQGVSGGLSFFFWQLSAINVFIWTMWVVVIEGNGSFKFCHWLIKIKKNSLIWVSTR